MTRKVTIKETGLCYELLKDNYKITKIYASEVNYQNYVNIITLRKKV